MFESATGLLRVFGRKVQEEMQLQNISIEELAERCDFVNGELQEAISDGKFKPPGFKWADKIKEIRRASRPTAVRDGIKKVVPEEITVICRALNRPEEYMLNGQWNNSPIYLDPLFDENRTNFIGHLLKRAEEKARVLTGWAEFLPCSLETPTFMYEHHRALHRENVRDEARAYELADKYDQIGGFRRARFLDPSRSYDFEHLIFFSDILRIVTGSEEYGEITPKLRYECLTNLAKMACDHSLNLRLYISQAENSQKLKGEMRGNDSMLVFGSHFTLWRTYDGSLYWSESDTWIKRNISWVDEFKNQAESDPLKIAELLNMVAKEIKGG